MNKIKALKDLSNEEILDMDLEKLAYLLLAEYNERFSKEPGPLLIYHVNTATETDLDVKQAVCEAYQWLYNKGLIMDNYLGVKGINQHFITRAGKKVLEKNM